MSDHASRKRQIGFPRVTVVRSAYPRFPASKHGSVNLSRERIADGYDGEMPTQLQQYAQETFNHTGCGKAINHKFAATRRDSYCDALCMKKYTGKSSRNIHYNIALSQS